MPEKIWDPIYDFGEGGGKKIEVGLDPTGDIPWKAAPGTSHVLRFRLYDVRNPLAMKIARIRESGRSEIHVQFKPSGRNPVTTYLYKFDDADLAEQIYLEMWGAAHPGSVIHQRLIKGGIPYERIS